MNHLYCKSAEFFVTNCKRRSLQKNRTKIIIFSLAFFLIGYSASGQIIQTLTPWTNLYNNNGTTYSNTSYTVPTGGNKFRILVVAVTHTHSATSTNTPTVSLTYGGQALTPFVGDITAQNNSSRVHTELYYLNETGLDAAAAQTAPTKTTLSLTYTITGGTSNNTTVFAAVYDGVDQSNPITYSQNRLAGTTATNSASLSSAISVDQDDLALEVISAVRNGNTTAFTINSPPTNWSLTSVTATNSDYFVNAVATRSVPTSTITDLSTTGTSTNV
ncbi:MAG TPA: hypothetical protein VGQ59_02300, partial [Cyclobacteriaceae bacterium]|nr:hypothetical protein [Cyclobacteriaceae bacterium]